GASGGNNSGSSWPSNGGLGGRVQCTLAVTPGQVLQVYVGGAGAAGTPTVGGAGGYNGGASGAMLSGSYGGGGGGGATDIRVLPYALANRLVVAGGAGGAGLDYANGCLGGNGGGTTAQNGEFAFSYVFPGGGNGQGGS